MRSIIILLLCSSMLGILQAQSFIPNSAAYNCQALKKRKPIAAANKAANSRTDTIDVLHYVINLDIDKIAQQRIDGHCQIKLVSKIAGLQEVQLDLLGLTVDSVGSGPFNLSHSQSGELLQITLPFAYNAGDTIDLDVYYGGNPVKDASGWGGFYFSSGYAFNLGVGFAADPHNYGRVWFPCVDNFVDRATYEFYITTTSTNKAFCNGLLADTTHLSNGNIIWHWQLGQTIPTYLASVAVTNYISMEDTYVGVERSFPIIIAAKPSDTANARASFVHLPDAIEAFEMGYGPQPFDRVGFALVPFSSGAMEHASNIAFPVYAADGSLEYESLMAHELAHHWWGDQVTCETAEDMWLNEGWASYSENLFYEHVYGYEAYKNGVRTNHYDVLRMAHISDDGFRAVSGVPHEYTYGDHVYNKGADVIHSLRSYIGDNSFFDCIAQYQRDFAFDNANSIDFRDALSACSGYDLTNYFNDWIFAAGFTHISIDSFTTTDLGGTYAVAVSLRQKLRQAPALYTNVPVELTFYSANWDALTVQTNVSGACGTLTKNLPFEPVYVAVDMQERISDATTDMYHVVSDTGLYDYKEALMTISVAQVTDSALIRVEHNWVAPDPLTANYGGGLHISRERYFKVDGIFTSGLDVSATFEYNGSTSGLTGYLDTELLATGTEDSLVLCYRRSARTDWSIFPDHVIDVQGSTSNRRGQVTINGLVPGEYALAIYDASRADSVVMHPTGPCNEFTSAGQLVEPQQGGIQLYPNPAKDSFTIEFQYSLAQVSELTVTNMAGEVAFRTDLEPGVRSYTLTAEGLSAGMYMVNLYNGNALQVKRLLILE